MNNIGDDLKQAYEHGYELGFNDGANIVRCGECKNSSRIASDTTGSRVRHCWNGRGRNNGDGFSRVYQDDYCDDGERKEGERCD